MNKEKDELFAKAEELGLKPHHAAGEVKLKRMIDEEEMARFNGTAQPTASEAPETSKTSKAPEVVETKVQRHARLRDEQRALVRVIVRCNNDMKKESTGETVKVSNSLHTFTRFVPFDNENGWHIELAVYNMLKERMCTRFKDITLKNGQKHRESYLISQV